MALARLVLLTVSALFGLVVAQPANSSKAAASAAAYWDGIGPSAAQPGLWKCATERTSTRSGDGAVMAVSWGRWAFALVYVSEYPDQVLPGGHPTAQAVELSDGPGHNVFTANFGPDGGLNLIVSGVCLVHFQASGPPAGLLAYEVPGTSGCCAVLWSVTPGAAGKARVVDLDRAIPITTRLRGVGRETVVVSGDLSFFGQFTDDADSTWPLLVLSARYGNFIDVTGAYRSLAQADAGKQWKYYQDALKDDRPVQGVLASWAADECSADDGPAGWATLEALNKDGVLLVHARTNGTGLTGGAYLASLRTTLHAHGYCEADPLN